MLEDKYLGNILKVQRRTEVSSESSLDGKLFVYFVALIYMSYLKRRCPMRAYSIEAFEHPGHALRVSEVTKKQEGLYKSLGGSSPTTL